MRIELGKTYKQILTLKNKRRGELCLSHLVFIVVFIDSNTLFKIFLVCIRKKTDDNTVLTEISLFSTIALSFERATAR